MRFTPWEFPEFVVLEGIKVEGIEDGQGAMGMVPQA